MRTEHATNRLVAAIAIALVTTTGPAFADDQEDADALFAAQTWAEASVAYEALLDADGSNASNWFNLGQAHHQLDDLDDALAAYENAIAVGFQPAARAHFHMARALMTLGQSEVALDHLEEIAIVGGPSHQVLLNTAEFASLADEARFQLVIDALRPCNTDEYRQFDFWLGEWDVIAAGSPQSTAVNEISSVQGGCAVFEQYTAGGFTGMSLNFYDSTSERWHQTWMSNAGGAVYLEGGLNAEGAMEMTDRDLPISAATGTINKVTWTPNEDGSVRQLWESSTDSGETWALVFDGAYMRRQTVE